MAVSGVATGQMTDMIACHVFLFLIVKSRIELGAVNVKGVCKNGELLKYTRPFDVVPMRGITKRKRLVLHF